MGTRRTRRWAVALIGAIGGVMLFAPSAQAKGDMVTTVAQVVITGPGLSQPIELSWRGSCFAFAQAACSNRTGFHPEAKGFPKDLGRVDGPFWTFATQSNFLSQVGGTAGGFRAPADAVGLGPKYDVTWTLRMSGPTAETVQQDLYPFGPAVVPGLPSVPWTFTPHDQMVAGNQVAWGWMPMPASVRDQLIALGLPKRAPAMPPQLIPPAAGRPAIASAPVPASASASDRPVDVWPLVVGVSLLCGLVAMGVRAGRPRRRLQAA